MGKARTIIGAAVLFVSISNATAGYVETVRVRYHQNYEVTPWEAIDVEFVTGTEITKRVTGYFPFLHSYAIISVQGGGVIVLKLDNITLCSGTFRRSCFPLFENIRGYDRHGQAWEICTSTFCP